MFPRSVGNYNRRNNEEEWKIGQFIHNLFTGCSTSGYHCNLPLAKHCSCISKDQFFIKISPLRIENIVPTERGGLALAARAT
jgi:hypothetical protein